MEACPACGSTPRTPLLCENCGTLLAVRAAATPFAVLGLEPAFVLDLGLVKQRLLTLSRALHPDFHRNADDATRRLSEDNTAALNTAFQVLADEARRADYLVKFLGGPREDEERSMPAAFLQEVLEWNEAIEEARGSAPDSDARAALGALEERLARERAESLRSLRGMLEPLPARGAPVLREARQRLNAVRYLDRALGAIAELGLATRTH